MRCEEIGEWLSDHLDGQLDPDRAKLLTDHLTGCANCRQELEELRQTVALLHDLEPVEPPAGLLNRVRARLAREDKRSAWNILSLPQARIAIAACLLILVGVYGLRRIDARRTATQVTSDAEALPALALEYTSGQAEKKETVLGIAAGDAAGQITEPRRKSPDSVAARTDGDKDQPVNESAQPTAERPAAKAEAKLLAQIPALAGAGAPSEIAGLPPPADGPAVAGKSGPPPSAPAAPPKPAGLFPSADGLAAADKPRPRLPSATAATKEQDGRIWEDDEVKSDTRLASDSMTKPGLSVGTENREEAPAAMRARNDLSAMTLEKNAAAESSPVTTPALAEQEVTGKGEELKKAERPSSRRSPEGQTEVTVRPVELVVASADPASVLRAIRPAESTEKSFARKRSDAVSDRKAEGYAFTKKTETSDKIVVQVQVPAAAYPQFLARLQTLGTLSLAEPTPEMRETAPHAELAAAGTLSAPVKPGTNIANIVHVTVTILRSATGKAP